MRSSKIMKQKNSNHPICSFENVKHLFRIWWISISDWQENIAKKGVLYGDWICSSVWMIRWRPTSTHTMFHWSSLPLPYFQRKEKDQKIFSFAFYPPMCRLFPVPAKGEAKGWSEKTVRGWRIKWQYLDKHIKFWRKSLQKRMRSTK